MKFHYTFEKEKFANKYDLCSYIGWNNLSYENLCKTSFIIDNNFNDYKFKRIKNISLTDQAIKRLKELRNKYDFIRFWYSGGKDSQFVLQCAEMSGVTFDEILTFVPTFFDNNELKNLSIPEYYTKNNKHKIWKLTPKHYETFYSQPNWWHDSKLFDIQAVLEHPSLINFVNPIMQDINIPNNSCDIGGIMHPTIWFDNKWKFNINEYQGCEALHSQYEHLLLSSESAYVLEAYVNNAIDALEEQKMIYNLDKMQELTKNSEKNQNNRRYFRDLIPVFKNMKVNFQYPKRSESIDIKEPWARWNDTIKDKLNLTYCFQNEPSFFKYYCKSDWKKITKMTKFGALLTKEFTLKT